MRMGSRLVGLLTAVAFLAFSTSAPIAHLHLSDEASHHHPMHAETTLYHAHFDPEPAESTSDELEEEAPVHGEIVSLAVVEPPQRLAFEPISIISTTADTTVHLATAVSLKTRARVEAHLPHGPPLLFSQPFRAPPA